MIALYIFFILATFLIQIVFLNMLIAIMGDTFSKVTENKDNNARKTKLEIMGDYIDLIDRDEEESDEDATHDDDNGNGKPDEGSADKTDSSSKDGKESVQSEK